MVTLRVKEAEVPPHKALQNWTSNMFTLLSVEDQGFTPRWVGCTMSLGLWQNPIAGEKKSEKKIDIEFSLNTVKEESRFNFIWERKECDISYKQSIQARVVHTLEWWSSKRHQHSITGWIRKLNDMLKDRTVVTGQGALTPELIFPLDHAAATITQQ